MGLVREGAERLLFCAVTAGSMGVGYSYRWMYTGQTVAMRDGCGVGAASLRRLTWCVVALLVAWVGAGAQTAATVPFDGAALVRRAVQHRLDMNQGHTMLRYVVRRKDAQRETTKEIIETKDGDVARLIAIDGKPLSAEAERAEMERLDFLAAHPELEERRHKSEMKDQARIDRLLGVLPDAEIYSLEGIVPCDTGKCYRLSFMPNPRFVPPDIESDFLRGFAGEVWIDQAQERLTRLDAHLIMDIDFGFGTLGKVNKGGTAEWRQTDVGGHEWKLTELKVNLTGKALMVKSVKIQIEEAASDFSPVASGISYRDAIAMLKRPKSAETSKQ